MSEFWPEAEPTSARNNLKTALSAIRKVFRDAGIEADAVLLAGRDAVRWIARVTVDSREFERCSLDIAAERRRALELYRGELIPGDYAPWASELRDRLAARFEDVLRAELAVNGEPSLAQRLLVLDPFCADAYVVLIEDALRGGNRRKAQAVFRRCAAALAEIGSAPSAELAVRVGIDGAAEPEVDVGFIGRSSEIAELRGWLADPDAAPVAIVSGIAGIGKSALAGELLRERAGDELTVVDAEDAELGAAEAAAVRTIVCARPERLTAIRVAFPEAREIPLGPLAREEVALALARCNPAAETEMVWQHSGGHPLLLRAEIARLAQRAGSAAHGARQRFPREVERCFAMQLRAAGDDAARVAELLALESQLDADDLAALLDWSLERTVEARERLAAFGIVSGDRPVRFAYPLFAEIATRALSPGRRHGTIARIAQRLMLHEHPSAKLRLAEHSVTLGRERAAAAAYLDAGRAFVSFGAWSSGIAAFEGGIALLEPLATSEAATELLRDLYLARGDALYHAGTFAAALRSMDAAVELTDPERDVAVRAGARVTIANALLRLNHVDAAWSAARQAEDEGRRASDLRVELEATVLVTRLLNSSVRCEEALERAGAGYERAIAGREWMVASTLAQRAADASRRLLRFEDCFHWVQRQLAAAVLAGSVAEAMAHYGIGSVEYAVNHLDRALVRCREGLRLIAGVRRRHTLTTLPLGLIEWYLHQALAHTYVVAGSVEDSLAECEWLVASPWARNTATHAAITLATVVDARLAADTDDDRRAAIALAERTSPPPADDPVAFLDVLTRARLAALTAPAERAVTALHEAYAALVRAEPLVPDQIHISYGRLARAARGIDDLLAARAAEAQRRHRQRVIEAAGPLWTAS